MHASTWLPWTFFGPMLLAIVSGISYQWTQIGWLASVAKLGLATCVLVAILAFAASFMANRKVRRRAHDDAQH